MPLAHSKHRTHAYVVVDRGQDRIQLHGYSGDFSARDIQELIPHLINFEAASLPGASDECFMWKGWVTSVVSHNFIFLNRASKLWLQWLLDLFQRSR